MSQAGADILLNPAPAGGLCHSGLAGAMQLPTPPSPGANATNGRGIGAGLSPEGRGATCRTVLLPHPIRGEAGPTSFRGRVRGTVVRSIELFCLDQHVGASTGPT